jgi:uncharacterized damage-inducible protein DinB
MTKMQFRYAACVMTVAAVLIAPRLGAQQGATTPAGIQGTLGKDVGTLSSKFTGLAKVMADKYAYRPGAGVRSTGEVLNMIVGENGGLAGVLSGTAPARSAPLTDPAKMQEALTTSYASLQKAVSGLSDADLKATVKFFGQEMTKQDAVLILLTDQHEHLGQLIAYARTNGIVPPWSK